MNELPVSFNLQERKKCLMTRFSFSQHRNGALTFTGEPNRLESQMLPLCLRPALDQFRIVIIST